MATAPAPTPTAYAHIVKTPGVRGGRACIDGTRISVKDIVFLHKGGHPPHEMLTWFSSRPLKPAEVHAALAYYYDNTDEIEVEFAREERIFDQIEHQWADYAARHGGEPPEKPDRGTHLFAKPFPWPPHT